VGQVVLGLLVVAAAVYAAIEWGRMRGRAELSESARESGDLQGRVAQMESELDRLRAASSTTDSRIQVERSAQAQLAAQLKLVESENARLKEELAFYENLVPAGKTGSLTIQNLRVEPGGAPGEYRYRMLLSAGDARGAPEFRGHVQLVVGLQHDDRMAVVTLPDARSANDPAFRLIFRRMQRVEGVFQVDPGAKLRSVQVRIIEQGVAQPRATQSLSMP